VKNNNLILQLGTLVLEIILIKNFLKLCFRVNITDEKLAGSSLKFKFNGS